MDAKASQRLQMGRPHEAGPGDGDAAIVDFHRDSFADLLNSSYFDTQGFGLKPSSRGTTLQTDVF